MLIIHFETLVFKCTYNVFLISSSSVPETCMLGSACKYEVLKFVQERSNHGNQTNQKSLGSIHPTLVFCPPITHELFDRFIWNIIWI